MAKGLASKPSPKSSPGTQDQWVASLGFWLFATVAVGLAGAVLLLPRFHEQKRLVRSARSLKNEVHLLNEANRRLATQVSALRHDPFYIAETARREMGYRHPLEKRILVTSLCTQTAGTRRQEQDDPRWLAWLQRLYAKDDAIRRASLCVAAVLLMTASLAFCSRGRP